MESQKMLDIGRKLHRRSAKIRETDMFDTTCFRLFLLWNESTNLWNGITLTWNESTWNETTMERNDRIPTTNSPLFFLRDCRVCETEERARKLQSTRSCVFHSLCCWPYKKGGTNRCLQLLIAAKCYRGSKISQRDSKGPFHICERCLLHRTQMTVPARCQNICLVFKCLLEHIIGFLGYVLACRVNDICK